MMTQALEQFSMNVATYGYEQPVVNRMLEFLKRPEIADRFMRAPASTAHRFHHAGEGGLLAHTNEVLSTAIGLANGANILYPKTGIPNQNFAKPSDPRLIYAPDLVVAATLHDIQKIGDAAGRPAFEPNILKNRTRSEKIPWVSHDDCHKLHGMLPTTVESPLGQKALTSVRVLLERNFDLLPCGELSLALVAAVDPELYALLNDDVKFAIRHHDGMYGLARREITAGNETPLMIVLHAADMLSSRISGMTYRMNNAE